MARKKVLQDERRVEILLPKTLLIRLDQEAKYRNTNRSEALRAILLTYFGQERSPSLNEASDGKKHTQILTRFDNIEAHLKRMNAQLKKGGKRRKR